MGLFDFSKVRNPWFLNKNKKPLYLKQTENTIRTIHTYTDVAFSGTPLQGQEWYPLRERKRTAIPSRTGLYPLRGAIARILLLRRPTRSKNGYPGFWWFEYGIRDVGSALKSLEDRGYIVFATAKDSLNSFTIPQLKNCYPPRICLLLARKLTSLCV